MICTKKRLWLCCALLVANIAFIWGNSLLPREVSAALSRWVLWFLSSIHPEDGALAALGDGPLRKAAHFLEFCSLGMLLSWLYRMLLKKPWQYFAFPFLCGVATACLDETIQRFVPGRGPGILDVGIDTLGVTLGIVILYFVSKKTKSKYLEEQTL